MNYIPAERQRLFTSIIIGVSILIPLVVVTLLFIDKPSFENNINIRILPAFHAMINSVTAILLILAFIFIRQRKIAAHKTTMLIALLLSVVFLVSYLVYHSLSEPTTFEGDGPVKILYYFVLISHIILAAVIVPFVLFTFLRALTGRYREHKAIGKWTLPLWLYVAVTGVLVYLMISPYY